MLDSVRTQSIGSALPIGSLLERLQSCIPGRLLKVEAVVSCLQTA